MRAAMPWRIVIHQREFTFVRASSDENWPEGHMFKWTMTLLSEGLFCVKINLAGLNLKRVTGFCTGERARVTVASAVVVGMDHPRSLQSREKKILWLSHLGRLIRASHEQVCPASLREYVNLPRGSMGQVVDEQPKGRNYLEWEDIPDHSKMGPLVALV